MPSRTAMAALIVKAAAMSDNILSIIPMDPRWQPKARLRTPPWRSSAG